MSIKQTKLGWKLLTTFTVLAVVVLPLLSSIKAQAAATPGVNGLIAYSQSSFAGPIKTVKPDPNHPDTSTLTTDTNWNYYSPVWSPDGTKIAYLAAVAPTILFIAKSDGTVIRTLDDGRFYGEVSWSPDGTKLVVTARFAGSIFNIYTMNTDGTNFTAITNFAYNVRHPQFSPDGTKIAYNSTHDNDIHVMNANGSNDVDLTNGAFNKSDNPIWSPDGSKILFMTTDTGTSQSGIGSMNASGTGITTIASALLGEPPVYSPDGSKIAYSDSSNNLHIMNVNGTNDAIYSHDSVGFLDWQPLTLGPQGSASSTITTVNGKATLNVPTLYNDPYGGSVDKSTVSITSAPAHGAATVDAATGVITYAAKTVSQKKSSLLDRIAAFIAPPAYAATAADQFSFRVCSTTSASLCSTGTVSVIAGAPDTGSGQPSDNSFIETAATLSAVMLIAGIWTGRANMQKRRNNK